MGAVRYLQNWRSFLGKYDHSVPFAELNKLAYLRSYTEDLDKKAGKEQCLHHAAKWLIHSQEQGSTAGCGAIISIADGRVIIQKPQDTLFLHCCAMLPTIKHSGLRKPSMLPLSRGVVVDRSATTVAGGGC